MAPIPTTRCCIAGGGPAGIMLGYLLARAGVSVVILEKHGDFLRDFRGDTVHPSTLEVLESAGLLAAFERLPQQRVQQLGALIGGRLQPVIDFRRLKPFDYLSLVPQWNFLNFLSKEGKRYAGFDLRMGHEVLGLIDDGHIRGVRIRSTQGEYSLHSDLVVACDGRSSMLRESAGLHSKSYGAPMDVLWFKLPREAQQQQDPFALIGTGQMMVLLNRNQYWQAAYVVPKGSDTELRQQPIDMLRQAVADIAPFLEQAVTTLSSWDEVKTLEVKVDRLERWYRQGLLIIGDAAHAMSPVGGVGINLAIQDAVAAANELSPVLLSNQPVDEAHLSRVQHQRERPTRIIQALQVQIQNRVISRALAQSKQPATVPTPLRWLLQSQWVRSIPAWVIGYGFGRACPKHLQAETGTEKGDGEMRTD